MMQQLNPVTDNWNERGQQQMFQLHEYVHNTYGYCLWTLLAFLVLAIMLVMAIIHVVRQGRRNEKFDKEMTDKYEFDNPENEYGHIKEV